jgi:hypothetical protein
LARSQRSVSTVLVVVVALAGLLAAGRWLQPRLDGRAPVPASTRPLPTSPAPTSPVLPTSRPPNPSPVTRVLATRSQVDAIAVTRQAVWLAVGGVVMRMDPATGQALAVGAGPGAVWVRGTGGWLRRVDPARDRQVDAIRLPTLPDGDELPGKVVVAGDVLWVSDPGDAVVRRVDLRRGSEDTWEADGRDLAATPGGTVWATIDTRLLGLGGPQVRGPRRTLHELETDRITAAAAEADGGLWLGTPQGLFHVDQRVLGQG